jgi:CHASE2 domain-containing sensor protein
VGKLVVLKFGEGSFESGFPVTLQIGEEQDQVIQPSGNQASQGFAYRPVAEVNGRLPPALELLQYYRHWQATYRRLGHRMRLEAPKAQITNFSVIDDCQSAAQALGDRFNHWLRSESFRPIREKWLEQLSPTDSIRLILQTDDPLIQRLPWHSWELSDRYTQSELALSLPTYEHIPTPPSQKTRLNILAILGNSQGIDVQADRYLLEQLPHADVHFLVEPVRQQLTEQLWAQPWDILFFAGHSSSAGLGSSSPGVGMRDQGLLESILPAAGLPAEEVGQIYINATDSLTIDQLRYGLRKAVERGLKLAIFNSCDGLGLARNLADLQIPQMIVMREPVPDRVAQDFLKSFLAAFSAGEPLYQAVRQAREQLQGLEDQFPCATWLPILCQNPAALPPTWMSMLGAGVSGSEPNRVESIPGTVRLTEAPIAPPAIAPPRRISSWLQPLSRVLAATVLITAVVTGGRAAGWLQSAELQAFDQLMSIRPAESSDSRILIITINKAEQAQYGQNTSVGWSSLSDRTLNGLLTQLNQYQPRAIGLDLYRDFMATPEMIQQFRQNLHLVTVCKARYMKGDSIAPPPGTVRDRVGFSDFSTDPDDGLRRHLLAMTPNLIDPKVPCTTQQSFNLRLVAQYLQAQNILLSGSLDSQLQFGQTVLPRLQPRTSGYQPADAGGYQLLLNYRATREIATQVSLTDVLSGSINPNAVRDRLVLIGRTDAPNDFWKTPIDSQMPGILAHAHMISQLLSAVLDGRSLLWVWSLWQEAIWIGGWTLVGAVLAALVRSPLRLGAAIAVTCSLLYGCCWIMLLAAGWIPLVPPMIGLLLAATAVTLWLRLAIRAAES